MNNTQLARLAKDHPAFETWTEEVEAALNLPDDGPGLDTDQGDTGYSLDFAHALWLRGHTTRTAAAILGRGPLEPGDIAAHCWEPALDSRRVTRVEGDQLWLHILTGESGPFPRRNYYVARKAQK